MDQDARSYPPDWPQDLVESIEELPPHGRILCLSLPNRRGPVEPDCLDRALRRYWGQPTPFVGLLVDLAESDYEISEGDLASLLHVTAAGTRGWVLPCALALAAPAARALQSVLTLTGMSAVHELRVVEGKNRGLDHIRAESERRRSSAAR